MEIHNLSPGGFAANCYLVSEGSDAVLIDCTVPAADLCRVLEEKGLTLRAVLLTHGHFDHILTADAVRDATGVPLLVHRDDAELLCDSDKNAFSRFFGHTRTWRAAERRIAGGDALIFGELSFTVLHTAGHTRGSVTYQAGNIAFTGDTLFVGDVGRTDLYGGDAAALARSLRSLSMLPSDTAVYPGHGGSAPLCKALPY